MRSTQQALQDQLPKIGKRAPRGRNQVGKSTDTDLNSPFWLFSGYLVLIGVEYSGIAHLIPALEATHFSTALMFLLLAVAATKGLLRGAISNRQVQLILVLTIFTASSMLWATVQMRTVPVIREFIGYTAFLLVTIAAVDRKVRFDQLSVLLAVLVAVLAVRNFEKLTAATRSVAFVGPYFTGDANDLAWTLVIVMPLCIGLCFGPRAILTKIIGIAGAGSCLFGIVGSGSRGGAIGLVAATLYLVFSLSKRKLLAAVVFITLAGAFLAFAPSQYLQRLETVGSYEEDNSARSRLQVWGAGVQMALDYPLGVGAGNFSAAYGRYYLPPDERNSIDWAQRRWLGAHSIYFRSLGEYGFLGLGILLWLIGTNVASNIRAQRTLSTNQQADLDSLDLWPVLINASLLGYAFSGIFLGGLTYPHIFLLSALTIQVAGRTERKNADTKPQKHGSTWLQKRRRT